MKILWSALCLLVIAALALVLWNVAGDADRVEIVRDGVSVDNAPAPEQSPGTARRTLEPSSSGPAAPPAPPASAPPPPAPPAPAPPAPIPPAQVPLPVQPAPLDGDRDDELGDGPDDDLDDDRGDDFDDDRGDDFDDG